MASVSSSPLTRYRFFRGLLFQECYRERPCIEQRQAPAEKPTASSSSRPKHNNVGQALPTFDFTKVLEQFRADPHYADWPDEKLKQGETEYRQYMALCRSNPGQQVMPTRLGDDVWHQHILNTKQYVPDCRDYLGYYLHHQPTTLSEGHH